MSPCFVLPLLMLVGCSGWVDPGDFYLPGEPEPEAPQVLAQYTSRHSDTGELAARWTVLSLADGRVLKDGREDRYHPDGTPSALRHYTQGEPSGEWRSWYPDGTLRSEYTFASTPTPQQFYHSTGLPSAVGPAVAGVREGPWTFWYGDGAVRQSGSYLRGRKHGLWDLFHENGGLRSRGYFRDDERVGEWRHWPAQPPTPVSEWRPQDPTGVR